MQSTQNNAWQVANALERSCHNYYDGRSLLPGFQSGLWRSAAITWVCHFPSLSLSVPLCVFLCWRLGACVRSPVRNPHHPLPPVLHGVGHLTSGRTCQLLQPQKEPTSGDPGLLPCSITLCAGVKWRPERDRATAERMSGPV